MIDHNREIMFQKEKKNCRLEFREKTFFPNHVDIFRRRTSQKPKIKMHCLRVINEHNQNAMVVSVIGYYIVRISVEIFLSLLYFLMEALKNLVANL